MIKLLCGAILIFQCMLTILVDYFSSYLYSKLTQLNNIFNYG